MFVIWAVFVGDRSVLPSRMNQAGSEERVASVLEIRMSNTFERVADEDLRVTGTLCAIGLLSVVFGVVVVVAPEWAAANAGYGLPSEAGTVEFMTVYGGFYFGLGIFWVLAARMKGIREGAVASLALGSAGSGLVRGGSAIWFGVFNVQTAALLAFEIGFAVLGSAAWRWSRREDG